MVTAELAAALPVLVLLVAVALATVNLAAQRVRVMDAAREAARAAARGDPTAAVRYGRLADPNATITVARSGQTVRAEAKRTVHLLGGWLPSLTIVEAAVAAAEPDAAPP
jgi:Flp pilus assembly protein TadG